MLFGRFPFLAAVSVALLAGRAGHWAFEAPVDRPAPAVADPAWNTNPIDRWIKSRLDREGLAPAPEAARAALLRRASFALTGLPPEPAELDAFLADAAPGAWERQVDRLLASPHFGERLARAWLDSARYADSNGQDENMAMSNAWRYRDWVVDAFNRDLPFREFVRRQLAGDLLDLPGEADRLDALTATGFLTLGPKQLAEQDKDKLLLDVADEQIDTLGRAFLGIGLGCARCHDHKTDPVSARDYHALLGIFRSTRTLLDTGHVSKWLERDASPASLRADIAGHEEKVKRAAGVLEAARGKANEALAARLRAEAPKRLLGGEEAGFLPFATDRWKKALKDSPALAGWRAVRDAADPAAAWRADELLSAVRGEGPPTLADAAAWLGTELATLSAGPALKLAPGRRGGAWSEKSQRPLDVPHRAELEPETWTLEAWVKLAAIPSGKTDNRRWIVNKNGNEWVRGHIALVVEGRKAIAYLAPEGGRELQARVVSESILEKNEWTQLAATFDGSLLRLFVNGEPQSQVRVDRPRQAGDGHLRIGGRADGYSGFAEGGIDDVRFFRRALDPAEILRRFREPDAFQPEGLIQAWTFDPAGPEQERALRLAPLAALATGPSGLFALPDKPEPHWTEADRKAVEQAGAEHKKLAAKVPEAAMVLAVEDAAKTSLRVFQRGDHLAPAGEPVPRGLPTRLGGEACPPPAIAADRSGRRELAEWIADPRHPLAGRVMANRLWQLAFGEGLVRTPDDFGLTGEAPDHPELLDALALSLHRDGGSFKRLLRGMITSRAWRSSARPPPAARERDPDNRLLSHAHRRRLEAEMIRDAVLATAGRLERTRGGTLVAFKNRDYVPKNPDYDALHRRALYLPVLRDRPAPDFAYFDAPPASACIGRRATSVVALQGLYFLNAAPVRESAEALGRELAALPGGDGERLREAFRLLFTRAPDPAESERIARFLEAHTDAAAAWTDICHALYTTNEFLHLD